MTCEREAARQGRPETVLHRGRQRGEAKRAGGGNQQKGERRGERRVSAPRRHSGPHTSNRGSQLAEYADPGRQSL